MPESSEVYFATSNVHKYREVKFILRGSGLKLLRIPSKGVEIQADSVSDVARTAAFEAFKTHKLPLFVEDTMLTVTALRGFPGTYGSYVYRTIGPKGILRLLEGADTRSAEFTSAVAFSDHPGKPILFLGRLPGKISDEPRGKGGFGFDPVFIPDGEERTLAEMTMTQKCAISHRSKAVRAFASWYLMRLGGQPL